ncbi:MAG: ABC transporter permease [Clostridiales bacterium]|nr:ABC transporter permease [Clostridiales bacterium]
MMRVRGLASPYLAWMSIFIILPLCAVVYYAFTDSVTGEFTLRNIVSIGNYWPILIKSIWLALVSSLICLILGYPVALAIARAKQSRQRFLILLVMLPMSMSFLLRTIAWVSLLEDTGIINNILGKFGISPLPLIRNNGAVVLGMVYNYLPYMILPVYTVLSHIDPSLIEAAKDLGCNRTQVFLKVILPLSVSGIISGVSMVFVPAVSTFYISKKLGGSGTTMIGDVIESQFKTAYNPNLGAAISLVLMVMVFICIGLMERFSGSEEREALM